MSFADQMNAHIGKYKKNLGAIREGTDEEMFRSIVEGSELSGSPGQPVHTGKLKASWATAASPNETVISSDDPAALAVEENWSNGVFETGGPHNVKLTVVAFPRIVTAVAQRVRGDA